MDHGNSVRIRRNGSPLVGVYGRSMTHRRFGMGRVAAVLAVALVMVAGSGAAAGAQSTTAGGATAAAPAVPATVKVYLDCSQCDFNNLRQDITYVSYVNARQDADVHVLISTENTASGGREYTFDFIGQGAFAELRQKLNFTSSGSDTEDERRRGVSRTFALGLTPFLLRTSEASRFSLQYARPSGQATTTSKPAKDPWDSWIFRLGSSLELNGETRQKSNRIRGNFSGNRTTQAWKFSFNGNLDFNNSEFTLSDGRIVESESDSWNFSGSVIKSLAPEHWAALVRAEVRSSTQSNEKLELRQAVGIEWDYFPYADSTRRSMVLQYSAGVSRLEYYERTLFGKTEETLFDHRLAAILALRQTWGSWRASAAYSAYLHDGSKNNLDFFVDADVRLFRGFSLNIEGSYARVRDQLYLAAGGATDEEVLLRLRRLETGYRYRTQIGFSYQFGSIYNNVVNPRWSATTGRQFGQ